MLAAQPNVLMSMCRLRQKHRQLFNRKMRASVNVIYIDLIDGDHGAYKRIHVKIFGVKIVD